MIDENGRYVSANEIIVLLYYYLLKYKGWKGAAVRNVATTHLLDRVAEKFGERCVEVPVGFKHISAGMQRYDALIGGESSGGLTVRGHIFGKDGGKEMARKYGIPLLGQIPLVQSIRECGDSGEPAALARGNLRPE